MWYEVPRNCTFQRWPPPHEPRFVRETPWCLLCRGLNRTSPLQDFWRRRIDWKTAPAPARYDADREAELVRKKKELIATWAKPDWSGWLGCWDAGRLGCWEVGMLGGWDAGRLGCWVLKENWKQKELSSKPPNQWRKREHGFHWTRCFGVVCQVTWWPAIWTWGPVQKGAGGGWAFHGGDYINGSYLETDCCFAPFSWGLYFLLANELFWSFIC